MQTALNYRFDIGSGRVVVLRGFRPDLRLVEFCRKAVVPALADQQATDAPKEPRHDQD